MRTKARQIGVALIALLALALGRSSIHAAAATPGAIPVQGAAVAPALNAPVCGPDWSVVPSPNWDTSTNFLTSVAAVSAGDLWAVGNYYNGTVYQTLIEHSSGGAWTIVPSPNVGPGYNLLNGVAAVSSSDVWAVGYSVSGAVYQTLIERWNGSAWNVVSSPNGSATFNELKGVAVVSANNVWAVGDYATGGTAQTLIEHWNGSAWSIVPSPNPGASAVLKSVAAVSGSAAWAVGSYVDNNRYQTLVEYWDGTVWAIVPSPNPGVSAVLSGVAAVSPIDVWAVGSYQSNGPYQTLIEHWDGSAWSIVSSPNPGINNSLFGLAVVGSSDVWAVGWYSDATGYHTLVEHWVGGVWSVVPSPNGYPGDNLLYGVAAAGSGDIWAVGNGAYQYGGVKQTLVEHWDGSAWLLVTSANVGVPQDNVLQGIAAVSGSDAWAVGRNRNFVGADFPLLEHWDGSAWRLVPSPYPDDISYLKAVAAVGSSDVWAVGVLFPNCPFPCTPSGPALIEHWDGNAWTIVPSPIMVTSVAELDGVAAISASNIWAVGTYQYGGVNQTLIEHWDGSAWAIVPSPSPGTAYNQLTGVAAVSASDVWAVGTYRNSGGVNQTLIEHWDGSAWTIRSSPSPGLTYNQLNSVAAVAAGDVWAVGYDSDGQADKTLIEHWDGNVWSTVASPNVGTQQDNRLKGVTAAGSSAVWAVGYATTSGGVNQTLVEHWAGTAWTILPSPNVGGSGDLNGAAAVSGNDVWAVGAYFNAAVSQTLVERYNPCSPSPTSTSTPLPVTPNTATPTVCTITFSDVDQNNPFYAFIRCLACRQIVSGYSDGTYRWGNNVTRGQTAKIVSNAAGFTDAIGSAQQSFEDVPNSGPFWLWIERLASRGYISGYACGGSGEPCVPPANRPYFRPNADVTRGQLSKIVASAAGYSDVIPSTQQTFADVPSNNSFWLWIERLGGRGIISGYQCGGAGEPCVPPGNRPYFRWGATATRGQLSKIAAQTFYPNCATPARR